MTWPANSGAPVFVHFPQRVRVDESAGSLSVEEVVPRLLGLSSGHYVVPAAIRLRDEEGATALHSGISVVTPASAILEITRRQEHVAWREAEVARLVAQGAGALAPDGRTAPSHSVEESSTEIDQRAPRHRPLLFGLVSTLRRFSSWALFVATCGFSGGNRIK